LFDDGEEDENENGESINVTAKTIYLLGKVLS
jgi:hypothetical protein